MMDEMTQSIFSFGSDGIETVSDAGLQGNKGANLVAMAALGLPVPPGFVVGTAIGRALNAGEAEFNDDDMAVITQHLSKIGEQVGRKFGQGPESLLVSVRSGAAVSMPGMMDTVLNLGLNDETVKMLAMSTNDARFAFDTYRRFIQGFAQVVLGLDGEPFEETLNSARNEHGVDCDSDLSAAAIEAVAKVHLNTVEMQNAEPFPQNADVQLKMALNAVFKSWNTPRARLYRDMHKISHEGGTAAVVQAMVFGNRDDRSCTGVYFTRNPTTGEAAPYGEYMANAQGEDVVSGIRTPRELTENARLKSQTSDPSMEMAMPKAYGELLETGERLEQHFLDVQEIEFTVEADELFILQTRRAKCSPRAQLVVAVAMASAGLIDKDEAIKRIAMDTIDAMLVSRVPENADVEMISKGLAASPGVACGPIVLSSDEAVAKRKAGEACVLLRPETDPKDVHGMNAADGVLTAKGGLTSHAAVVALGMGKPCITAAMTMKIDQDARTVSFGPHSLKAGDVITIDGGSGRVYRGETPVEKPEARDELATLLEWRKERGL